MENPSREEYTERGAALGVDETYKYVEALEGYCEQKEKLLKQNTKLLAIYTVVIIAHVITTIIDQSYRNTLMFYFLTIVSLVYGIGCVVKSHKRKGGWNEYID